jgi:arylformamidase
MQGGTVLDKRVAFDFAVRFSNGGGLQGQGFRLDIDGDTISDDDLAAYLIRDLRLLMVEKVDIQNKQIIEEQHKRKSRPENAADRVRPDVGLVDLSHTIENGMVTYKNSEDVTGPPEY